MENNQAIIILNYKNEEKELYYTPNNYSELNDYFLSYYNEKNNKIYEFHYSFEEQLAKNKISNKVDARFNKAIEDIIANNLKIYINEEGDINEYKDDFKDAKTLAYVDDEEDEEDENEVENEKENVEELPPEKLKLELINLEMKKVKSEDNNKK